MSHHWPLLALTIGMAHVFVEFTNGFAAFDVTDPMPVPNAQAVKDNS